MPLAHSRLTTSKPLASLNYSVSPPLDSGMPKRATFDAMTHIMAGMVASLDKDCDVTK
jgi:hypothetical protein